MDEYFGWWVHGFGNHIEASAYYLKDYRDGPFSGDGCGGGFGSGTGSRYSTGSGFDSLKNRNPEFDKLIAYSYKGLDTEDFSG